MRGQAILVPGTWTRRGPAYVPAHNGRCCRRRAGESGRPPRRTGARNQRRAERRARASGGEMALFLGGFYPMSHMRGSSGVLRCRAVLLKTSKRCYRRLLQAPALARGHAQGRRWSWCVAPSSLALARSIASYVSTCDADKNSWRERDGNCNGVGRHGHGDDHAHHDHGRV